jgi:hypothetical protein
MGQGKDDVVIGRWQEFVHPALNPGIPFHASTVWAVPVAAGMVPVGDVATFLPVAPAEVIAFGCRMACGKVGKDGFAVWVETLYGRMSEQALEGDLS